MSSLKKENAHILKIKVLRKEFIGFLIKFMMYISDLRCLMFRNRYKKHVGVYASRHEELNTHPSSEISFTRDKLIKHDSHHWPDNIVPVLLTSSD